jgi:hypothetical protein
MPVEVNGLIEDVDQFLLTGNAEGIGAVNHLVQYHSDRPNINAFIILITYEDLWTEINWSSTEGGSKPAISLHRPTEICYFYHSLHRERST